MNMPGIIKNNVLIGQDDHLFLFDGGQRSFAFLTGDAELSSDNVAYLVDNLEQRRNQLRARGVLYQHLVFPSKEIVLQDKVPSPWRERINSLFLSRYVARQPVLQDMVLYPLELLQSLNRSEPVFRILDSHMTDAGTMAVVQHLLCKWGLQYNTPDYFLEFQEMRSGDLGDMLGINKLCLEVFFRAEFKFLMFDNRKFLPGNTNNICVVHNPMAQTDKRLLIFGDSFIKYALPYFAPVFRDIVYVRSATFQLDMVDLMSPNVVISSSAERYLSKVDPDSHSIPMLLAGYGNTNYSPSKVFGDAYIAQFSWNYHRRIYDAWSQEKRASFLHWNGLGVCQPNQQVEVLDLAGNFRSIGIDPILNFPATSISHGNRYLLQFDLESDVDSFAAVYFQTEEDARYSEEKLLKLPVVKGYNCMQFFLPNVKLRSALRVDPLACVGAFSIKNMGLKVLDDSVWGLCFEEVM